MRFSALPQDVGTAPSHQPLVPLTLLDASWLRCRAGDPGASSDSAGAAAVEPWPGSVGCPRCPSNLYAEMPVLLVGRGGLPAGEWL